MKNLLILERSVSEASFTKTDNGDYVLEGIFSEIGKKNKNNRIYDEDEFIPHVEEMAKKVKDKKILGELDHPKQFEVSLKNVSHVIEDISYDKETKQVRGKIKLLDTDAGKQAKALVDAGVPIHISSRAAGVVEGNGHVKVKRLFTYDLVADPGFENAQLNRVNESFGLEEDSDIQIFEMSNSPETPGIVEETPNTENKSTTTVNETKDESFVSLKDFETYSNYIKEEFKKMAGKLVEAKSLSEGSTTNNDDLTAYVESLAKEINNLGKKISAIDENVDHLIAHNDYIIEGLESVKDYAELISVRSNENIGELKESQDSQLAYTQKIVEGVNSRFAYQQKINEAVDGLISHNDYIIENMEGIANFSEYIKENLEKFGTETNEALSKLNESVKSAPVVENNTENVDDKPLNEDNNSTSDNKVDKIVVKSNDEWKKSMGNQINNLLESAKTQKAVEDDKDLHFLHFLDESRRNEFEGLEEETKNTLVEAFKTNKYFGTRDVEAIWENAMTPETPTINWLENMPAKYKESYENLTESKQEEIKLQASVLTLDSQYKIDHFWSTRDLRNEKVDVNESKVENINESVKPKSNDVYMNSVTEGLMKRFKTNKY